MFNGKGAKDRVVPLPDILVPALKVQIAGSSRLLAANLADGFGEVSMPEALIRKWAVGHAQVSTASSDARSVWLALQESVNGRLDRARCDGFAGYHRGRCAPHPGSALIHPTYQHHSTVISVRQVRARLRPT